MNVYERQARALESIARELKGIGKTLGQIKEIFSPDILLVDEGMKKDLTFGENDQEEPTSACPGFKAYCYDTGLPCKGCTPGECKHRYMVGGGNG